MSEHAPSAPAKTEQTPAPAEDSVEQAAAQIESILDSPKESSAKQTLNNSPQLGQAAEKEATWRVKSLNKLDRAQRHARLLSAREWRLEGRVGRLERQLATAKPGSRKHMRIKSRLDHSAWKKEVLSMSQDKIFDRINERSAGFSKEIGRHAEIERKRNELVVKRKIAVEAKRRRKVKEQYEKELEADRASSGVKNKLRKELYSDVHRRERLRQQIESWKGNSISKLQAQLLAEVEKKYDDRIKGGTL